VACVVAALAVLVACSDRRPELTLRRPPVSGGPSSTMALPSSTAAPTTPAPTTTVAGAPTPAVSWQACGEGLECGTLKVLLDHADASKGTIDLYVERRKALKRGQRIGTMLVNPGGPGVAGTQLVEQASFYFSQALRDRFDIVSWDPRGTGRSIPLDCVDDLDPFLIGADPTPDSPEDQQQAAALTTAFVTGCQTRSGPLLPYVSTQATAQDMDTLRQALGEPKVSYFGFSYGSELGATWATMFPGTVRAAVLDGAAIPNAGWEGEKTEQAVGLERAFLTVMQSCAADPGCPFSNGGDPVSAYEALSASLDAAPVTGDPARPPANQSVLHGPQ
jgi:pimeloyl-ACP methyl ester carboxylesterase